MNLGAIFNGIAGTVFFAGPALLASIWFPPGQRTTATAIASFSGYAGFAATFVLGNLNQIVTRIVYSGHVYILKFSTTPCMSLSWSHLEHQRQKEFEDTKGVIRIRIWKKNRQHSGQKKTHKRTKNDLSCSRRVSSSCSTSGTRRVNLVTNPVISREWGKDREVSTTICDTDIP